MKKKVSYYTLQKWLLAGICFFVICSLLFSNWEGKKQDSIWLDDYIKFQQAETYYEQQDFDQAYPLYKQLADKPAYEQSVSLNWGIAQILKDRQKYTEAVVYFERIMEAYPAIVNNEIFCEEYAGALAALGDPKAEIFRQER